MDILALCKEFGVAAGILVAIAGMFFFLLKWVLEQFKVELTENRKERIEYLNTLARIKEGIENHNARSEKFMEHVGDEHSRMITSLGEINSSLVRINGYKDH